MKGLQSVPAQPVHVCKLLTIVTNLKGKWTQVLGPCICNYIASIGPGLALKLVKFKNKNLVFFVQVLFILCVPAFGYPFCPPFLILFSHFWLFTDLSLLIVPISFCPIFLPFMSNYYFLFLLSLLSFISFFPCPFCIFAKKTIDRWNPQ